jgi:hypothetical protein
MAMGDGIRRNVATVEPAERALLVEALIGLHGDLYPGSPDDRPLPGGVSRWFKLDELHRSALVYGRPEFLPWHRHLLNQLEAELRSYCARVGKPALSLHYWDWRQDPRSIDGLDLFTPDFMGYGGSTPAEIGQPWRAAGFYDPGADPDRDSSLNPAHAPRFVMRAVDGTPRSKSEDDYVLSADDYATFSDRLAAAERDMRRFAGLGGPGVVFRDPFAVLLYANVDRLFATWQTALAHAERLVPGRVYGTDLRTPMQPWSGGPPMARPWAPPDRLQATITYADPTVVLPPVYDTDPTAGSCTRAPILTGGKAYFFRGGQYVRTSDLVDGVVDPDYPQPIAGSTRWPWPAPWTQGIDAAITWPANGPTYVFRGGEYARLDGSGAFSRDHRYPMPIGAGWKWPAPWTDGIDAAVGWPDGAAYFFRGSECMRVTDVATGAPEQGYPRPIAAEWKGLWADGVDAGLVWPNGKAYFFKGSRYVGVDPSTRTVTTDYDYPLPITGHWPGLR